MGFGFTLRGLLYGRESDYTSVRTSGKDEMLGATRLVGEYRPTPKNGMVRDHYARLGFRSIGSLADGTTRWALDIGEFQPEKTHIRISEETNEKRRLQPAH